MNYNESRLSQVEVGVDLQTAFTAFTDELDLWWVRGPINSSGAGRLLEMRCKPGVGGRLLEVYDKDSGEGLDWPASPPGSPASTWPGRVRLPAAVGPDWGEVR